MPDKDLIALIFFAATIPTAVVACSISRYAREAAFFLMIALMPLVEKLSVNFDTHFWYRGTTRGFEFTCLDVLAIGVLVSSILRPKPSFARWFVPAGLGLMLLFFAYACCNVAYTEPRLYGMFELSKMVRGLIFFLAAAMFVRRERDLAILVLALCAAVCFEGLIALKQSIGGYLRVPGTLDDPNSLSMYLCTVTPIFVAAANSNLPRLVRMLSIVSVISGICCACSSVSARPKSKGKSVL